MSGNADNESEKEYKNMVTQIAPENNGNAALTLGVV